ncbi:MAG: hypothetical protein H7330_09895 [Hymenobacteraceae bacterium]|nr:hypothetical protein [Hymenobacteraceae bacterium]
MDPLQVPGPIPAAIKAQVKQHLRDALKLLQSFHLDLTATDRERLGSGGLGPESLPFAETARLLMTTFPNVLPRSVSDAEIATYGERLDTVTTCQDLLADVNAIHSTLHNLDIAAGSGLMKLARTAYRSAQEGVIQTFVLGVRSRSTMAGNC